MIPGSHIDKQGMGVSDAELQWLYDHAHSVRSILEIGSYIGRSTYALCEGCPGIVYSVDDWRGNADIEEAYLNNLKRFENLQTLRMSSENAEKQLGKVDMIFIDGSHDYQSIKNDIILWKPHATKLLCGHDYAPQHPGVIKAIEEILGPVQIADTIWYTEIIS